MASIHDNQDPTLAVQGTGDVCANNVVEHWINGDMGSGALPGGTVLGNFFRRDARKQLRCAISTGCNETTLDFRPRPGSVLAGSAAAVGGIGGEGGDIGAYSASGLAWTPGCGSSECSALLPRPSIAVYAPQAEASGGWLAPLTQDGLWGSWAV